MEHLKAVAAPEVGDRIPDRVVLEVPDMRLPDGYGSISST